MTLTPFRTAIEAATHDGTLQDGVIGADATIPGLNGDVPLVYADYVASGRAMRQVEAFILEHVLPYYANSHTEASWCGAHITAMRRDARAEIARLTGAGKGDAVIFAGSGATAGLNRLVSLFGVNGADRPVVFVGPYEHHSNILPWRESKAEVVEIAEAAEGGPDLLDLARQLARFADADLKIGAFSAASNVSGVITDPDPVTRLLKENGALAVWDYAGGGPYLPISMGSGDVRKDAVVVSPHKFPGGPGASGVLILRKDAVRVSRPSWPGGGTVAFVSPWGHDYLDDIVAREEAGTPNIIGDIRAALAFMIKAAMGEDEIARREARFDAMAMAGWHGNPRLTLLGVDRPHRLPIFSFLVSDDAGAPVHPALFTRMLSDVYGIQARGGCACAGPYGHRLLGIGREQSETLRAEIAAGEDEHKPGWVRLNFSYMMDEATVRFIINSVNELSHNIGRYAALYRFDDETGGFDLRDRAA